jgi:hypothetical protein
LAHVFKYENLGQTPFLYKLQDGNKEQIIWNKVSNYNLIASQVANIKFIPCIFFPLFKIKILGK